MKFNGFFIAVIIVLMAGIILFETKAPSYFQWNDTSQSYDSKQPFGCYVMDSVLRASMPQGYEVAGSGIMARVKDEKQQYTFLFTGHYAHFANVYEVDMLQLIEGGNNVLFAVNDFYDPYSYNYYDDNSIGEKAGFSYHTVNHVHMDNLSKDVLSDHTNHDTINWFPDNLFDAASYPINAAFCQKRLTLDGSYRILATLHAVEYNSGWSYDDQQEEDSHHSAVAGIRDYGEGKGKLLVTSMPMIFSNYGILNDTIRPLVLRLLSECGNKPVVRYDPNCIDKTDSSNQESESPLRYLLANRPLRWAFYLALATVVAFVLFSARRRQRVIPVIQPPVNHMMDFVKRIGGIYYKRHDNVDLLLKKYATFSNDLRVKAMIDIEDNDNLDDELLMLSNRTGMPLDQLQRLIHDVKEAAAVMSIHDEKLKGLIDMMNDIIHRINI